MDQSTIPTSPSSGNEQNIAGPFGQPAQDEAPVAPEQSSVTITGSFRVVVYPGNSEYTQVPVDPKAIEAHEIRQSIRRLLDEE